MREKMKGLQARFMVLDEWADQPNEGLDPRWESVYASITPCETFDDCKVVRIVVVYDDLMYISQFMMNAHQEPYFKIIINQLVEEMDKQLK